VEIDAIVTADEGLVSYSEEEIKAIVRLKERGH
jgi:hypothetical protein